MHCSIARPKVHQPNDISAKCESVRCLSSKRRRTILGKISASVYDDVTTMGCENLTSGNLSFFSFYHYETSLAKIFDDFQSGKTFRLSIKARDCTGAKFGTL